MADLSINSANIDNVKTQVHLLRRHFIQGKTITQLDASVMFGISHLPRRILDLKERGMKLDWKWKTVKKKNNVMARVKDWKMIEDSTSFIPQKFRSKKDEKIICLELRQLELESEVRNLKQQLSII